ncbi:MAG TPA: xylulokinase [Candidatus Angelobacter sp.]|jgi:xylulokinase|nr:xylulokinase [Candidatus Angelobacter sp.]
MKTLGIDVGTGGSRALLVDERGRVICSATSDHAPILCSRPGWAEQEPEDWWRATLEAVKDCLAKSGTNPREILGIGLSGQMHGMVLLDASDKVLRPAIIWCDQRTEEQAKAITARVGANELINLTANPALTNFTLTKLWWVRQYEPEVWSQIQSLLLPKDYVRFRLTGAKATDVADASGTLLLDVARRQWSQTMLEVSGIDTSILPQLFESQEITGEISAEAAQLTGLLQGTPVVAGAGDQAAGAIGMGIVQSGAVNAIIGSSGVVFAATDAPCLDPKGRLHTFCHAIPNRWHVMGVTQAAGLSLQWFRNQFGTVSHNGSNQYESLMKEASKAPAGAEGLLWAPYLLGERTPHLDPEARGVLFGLTVRHTRAHIIRAILEGVAFSLRDTLTILAELNIPARSIRLGGGGVRSPLWRQIQADIYGMPVDILEAEEGAAFGTALLAGVGTGIWPDVDAACKTAVRVAERIKPDAKTVPLLDRQYTVYQKLYPALRQISHEVHALQIQEVADYQAKSAAPIRSA